VGTGVLGDNVKTNMDAFIAMLTTVQKNAFTDALRKSMVETMFNAVEDWVGDQQAVFSLRTANNVGGGTATTGSLQIYPINTTEYNSIVGCSRSTTDITLPAGTFTGRAYSSFFNGTGWSELLFYTTGGTLLGIGSQVYVGAGVERISNFDTPPFVLAAPTVVQLKYSVGGTVATYGLGARRSDTGVGGTIDNLHGQIVLKKVA
jgi:hypothetical protein